MYQSHFKKKQKLFLFLSILRFIAVFAVILLILNPKWEQRVLFIQKPKLVVAVDNSKSVKNIGVEKKLLEVLQNIRKNKKLNSKFDLQFMSFGQELKILDSLNFDEQATDFSVLLNELNNNTTEVFQKNPTIILSDGNQTQGGDYSYFVSKNPIFPIVFGDTTQYSDIFISKINVNQYAFLENQFPVEIFSNYLGNEKNQTTELQVFEDNKKIHQSIISFNPSKTFEKTTVMLTAEKVGNHYYSAILSPIKAEKNIKNNRSDFFVEVLDQQSKILIVSSFYHPDLGAIKQSIESNKQRKADLIIAQNKPIKIDDYQLIILYQPTSEMASIFNELTAKKKNYFIITGTKTDWNFLNNTQSYFKKNLTNLKEQYRGIYNINYPNFTIPNFGWENLPPLFDVFGDIKFNNKFDILFFQKVGNTQLETPLLATFEENNIKHIVLLGEGLWQWKMSSFNTMKSFEPFNQLISSLIQYTSDTEKNDQLKLNYSKIIYKNQNPSIKAQFFDESFKLDTRVELTLQLIDNKSKQKEKRPFFFNGNEFEVKLNNLKSNDYSFNVLVENKNITKAGTFRVLDYSIEDQFVSANFKKLQTLANNSFGDIVLAKDSDKIIQKLLNDDTYKNIQKNDKKITPIIDWKWLLALILLSLSAEWFIRKYRGLI